jgi:hypothetical protein
MLGFDLDRPELAQPVDPGIRRLPARIAALTAPTDIPAIQGVDVSLGGHLVDTGLITTSGGPAFSVKPPDEFAASYLMSNPLLI